MPGTYLAQSPSNHGMDSFRTKRGRCVFDTDAGELRLTSSWRGQFRRYYEGSKPLFALLVLAVVALLGFLATADSQRLLLFAGVLVAVLVLSHAGNYLRGFSTADRIPLDAVVAADPVAGNAMTRPRFVVRYETDGGVKKRYVMLPSRYLSYTDEEFETAKRLFREHGVPVEGDDT